MNGDIVKNMQLTGLKNIDVSALKDISQIKIDGKKTAEQRVLKFIGQTRNPYFFKVGSTPVKVVFEKKYANVSIEATLAKIVSGRVG